MRTDLTLRGDKEISAALRALGAEAGMKAVRSAARHGMLACRDRTKTLIAAEATDSGAWLAAVGLSTLTPRRLSRMRSGAIVGAAQVVARGRSKKGLAIYNAARAARDRPPVRTLRHFLLVDEYGYRGRPGKHIMARALWSTRGAVVRRMAGKLRKNLEREWQRRTSQRR